MRSTVSTAPQKSTATARPRPGSTERIFYDGHCGLCHGFVRFVLKRDERGSAFRFAPLQGSTFRAEVPEGRRAGLPDSIVVLTTDRRLLTRSAAVLHVLERLQGGWRTGARLAGWIPASIADAIYDGVARVRGRLFRRPPDTCPIVPASLRDRFEP